MHKNCAHISQAGEELCHGEAYVEVARKDSHTHTGRFIGGSGDAHKGVFLSIFLSRFSPFQNFPFMCFEKMSKRSEGNIKFASLMM